MKQADAQIKALLSYTTLSTVSKTFNLGMMTHSLKMSIPLTLPLLMFIKWNTSQGCKRKEPAGSHRNEMIMMQSAMWEWASILTERRGEGGGERGREAILCTDLCVSVKHVIRVRRVNWMFIKDAWLSLLNHYWDTHEGMSSQSQCILIECWAGTTHVILTVTFMNLKMVWTMTLRKTHALVIFWPIVV